MYRYERKFIVKGVHTSEIENLIYSNPYKFSEIYKKRSINNIYFDTIELKNFYDNINGSMDRTKVRIRWYNNLFGLIEKPKLEFKIKKGLSGTKKIYSIMPFENESSLSSSKIISVVCSSDLINEVKQKVFFLEPKIINKYDRKYFRSFDKKYRITLDTNQKYCDFRGNKILNKYENTCDLSTIVELKYDIKDEENAHVITNAFPFRITKSSKYVNAIENLFF